MKHVPPDQLTADAPREACGVFGIWEPGREVAHLTFDGLYALQHRGQESAGMAVTDGTEILVVKDMGLVTNVFTERNLAGLHGHSAIGHTRYSTTGASSWHNAQPVYRTSSPGPLRQDMVTFALGHNGNLTNTDALAAENGHAARDRHQRQRPDRRAGGAPSRRPSRGRSGGRARRRAAEAGRRLLAGASSTISA